MDVSWPEFLSKPIHSVSLNVTFIFHCPDLPLKEHRELKIERELGKIKI